MNPLQELRAAGQSIWLDFLRRGLVTGGGLQRLVDGDSVTGVTSNPSIFGKAIEGSTDYDEAVARIAEGGGGRTAIDVFYELALQDIRMAADVFRPIYDRTHGADGFASFEVEPRLARDAEGSIAAARDLWGRIDRPNLMIKVPGTREGVPAVEELTASGANVNITLLFSVSTYERVAEAYLAGLERRLDAGEPLDGIASVASFFVSRVDSAVDPQLPEGSLLRGTIAIANAKLAYSRFRELFSGKRWERLAAAGARPQRPLWASTSTKNPAYRDTLYVEELIGPDTVNTMPLTTIDAFRDHGVVRPDAVMGGIEEARRQLATLRDHGVDLDAVTDRLLEDGIAAFGRDLDVLLGTIEAKLDGGLKGRRRQRAFLGTIQPAVDERLQRMARDDVVARIWRRDHTVWKEDPTEITDRLGWLTVMDLMHERYGELETFANRVAEDGFTTAVLLGMGGSSLAPEVLRTTFGAAEGALDLIVLDTTHPATIERVANELDLDHSLFVVASKSGTTTETLSHFAFFHERSGGRGERFIAITDPDTPLEALGREEGFRAVFLNPSDIGGRYSALSYFGLVPAALIGAPVHGMLDRAEEMACASDPVAPADDNPGAYLGAVMGEATRARRDKVTLVLPGEIASFGSWVEQLIAESTGKEGTGTVPVVGEDLGGPDVYGADRLFAAIGEHDGLDALEAAGHPVVRLSYRGPEQLGGEFFRWEFATAVTGHVLGINAFDQPNVREAKDATNEILASGGLEEPGTDDLTSLLKEIGPGDYVGIQAYLDRTPAMEERLQRARLAIRDAYRVATTVGFGPRFLHSTGQLHKGGPNSGVFIQIVDDPRDADVPIPGRPYTFGTLIDAQALGDLRSLRARGRRVARITVGQLVEVM